MWQRQRNKGSALEHGRLFHTPEGLDYWVVGRFERRKRGSADHWSEFYVAFAEGFGRHDVVDMAFKLLMEEVAP